MNGSRHCRPRLEPARYGRVLGAILWLALVGLGVGAAAANPDLEAKLTEANRLYEQGDYSRAIAAFSAIEKSGLQSAALQFNLANAYFKAGRIGSAIAHYRVAQLLAPRDPDIAHNLQVARARVPGGGAAAPNRVRRTLALLSVDEWAIAAAAALWVWLLLAALQRLRPAVADKLRRPVAIAAAACALAGAALAASYYDSVRTPSGVVIHDAAVARYGPFEESQKAFDLPEGTELTLLDRQGEWIYVAASANRAGWLPSNQVFVVSAAPPG